MLRALNLSLLVLSMAGLFFSMKHWAADPEGRVTRARRTQSETIRARFAGAGVAYAPREIYVRAFKHEAELELWARDSAKAPFLLVHKYAIVASSGGPGPKRREGDGQIPEGFYVIDRFNPTSKFHLSLGINYPNASDMILSDRKRPGGDIFIHGSDRTIGCLPLGNPGIEELYLIALDSLRNGQTNIPVHIFPARMTGPAWKEFAAGATTSQPGLEAFWQQLRPALEFFDRERRLPRIVVATDGRYEVRK